MGHVQEHARRSGSGPVTIIGNSWRPFGLRADPYFQEALTPDLDADHPISLFVGREEELRLLGNQMLGATSSRAVVQGAYGVGKTSFVNRLKTLVAEHGVLTHAEPVRVAGDMTVQGFAAEVLRALTQVRASQRAGEVGLPSERARVPARVGEAGNESAEAAAFWRRLGRLLDGEDVVGGGLSVAGVGASVTRGRIAAERRDVALYPELTQAVAYLAGASLVVAPTSGGRSGSARARAPRGAGEAGRVLIHVNNFENLTRADTARAAALVQDLRDYFLIPHSHWVFVGAADLEHAVFRASEAVSGIVPLVADLPPLTAEEMTALLARRYERLRTGLRFVPPVAPDAAEMLYRRYAGDLRNFLRLLSNAVQRTPMVGRPEPLSAHAVVHTMAAPYRRALAQKLGEVDLTHLAALVGGGRPGLRVRAADVAVRTGLAKGSVTELLARLEKKARSGTRRPRGATRTTASARRGSRIRPGVAAAGP